MKATRTDVAKLAGVSTATVSNVLNGSNKVKEKTALRVMQAVRELDYRPDMIARSMTTKRTMQIGIVLEDVTNPYYGELIREFESAANEKNYFVNICTGLHKLDNYFDNFITRRVDGVFVAALPYKFQEDKLYYLVEQGVKVLTSGNVNADFRKVSSIENDYLAAMQEAVSYLVSLGHERIAYLSGLGKALSYDLRCTGYLNMVQQLNLPCGEDLLIDGAYPYSTNFEAGYDCALRLLQTGQPFTAIICGNDLMALGAMKALSEHGLHVPEDVSVMGFDGIAMGKYWSPALTTMSVDKATFGRRAFELLYSSIVSDTTGYYKNKLSLIEGQSTAPRKPCVMRERSTNAGA